MRKFDWFIFAGLMAGLLSCKLLDPYLAKTIVIIGSGASACFVGILFYRRRSSLLISFYLTLAFIVLPNYFSGYVALFNPEIFNEQLLAFNEAQLYDTSSGKLIFNRGILDSHLYYTLSYVESLIFYEILSFPRFEIILPPILVAVLFLVFCLMTLRSMKEHLGFMNVLLFYSVTLLGLSFAEVGAGTMFWVFRTIAWLEVIIVLTIMDRLERGSSRDLLVLFVLTSAIVLSDSLLPPMLSSVFLYKYSLTKEKRYGKVALWLFFFFVFYQSVLSFVTYYRYFGAFIPLFLEQLAQLSKIPFFGTVYEEVVVKRISATPFVNRQVLLISSLILYVVIPILLLLLYAPLRRVKAIAPVGFFLGFGVMSQALALLVPVTYGGGAVGALFLYMLYPFFVYVIMRCTVRRGATEIKLHARFPIVTSLLIVVIVVSGTLHVNFLRSPLSIHESPMFDNDLRMHDDYWYTVQFINDYWTTGFVHRILLSDMASRFLRYDIFLTSWQPPWSQLILIPILPDQSFYQLEYDKLLKAAVSPLNTTSPTKYNIIYHEGAFLIVRPDRAAS